MNEQIYDLALQDQAAINSQVSAELSITRAKLHLADKRIMELEAQLADRADDEPNKG